MNTTKKTAITQPAKTSFPKVYWTQELSLGNEDIDEQHQKLFALTNELIDHSDAEARSEIINETLYELLQYIDVHFRDEEEMLQKINYPKLEEHKKIHRSFTKKIAMFCHDVVKGKSKVAEHLLEYLIAWLSQHTSVDDQDYKRYLQ